MAQEGVARVTKVSGENHPNGVLFHYFVKNVDEKSDVKLEILEMDDDLIQTFSNKLKGKQALNVKKGGNRFVWDMRYPGFKDFPGMVLYSSPNVGPKAVPGTYKARLTVNGQSITQEFEIVKDPRLPNTPEDYQKQFDYLITVRDKVSEAHQAILDIREVRRDLNYVKEKLSKNPDMQDIVQSINELDEKMTIIENNIHQTKNKSNQDALNYGIKINNRLAFLLADQQLGDYPPTDQAEEFRKEATEIVNKELKEINTLLDTELDKLNKNLQQKNIPIIAKKGKKTSS